VFEIKMKNDQGQIVTFEKEKSESSSEEKIEAQDTLKMI